MKEKMDQQGVALPPLCPCGVTAWDCNPDTCANNCVFYKNPKGKLEFVPKTRADVWYICVILCCKVYKVINSQKINTWNQNI